MPYVAPKVPKAAKTAPVSTPDPAGMTAVTGQVFEHFLATHPPALSKHESLTIGTDQKVSMTVASYIDEDAKAIALSDINTAITDATPEGQPPEYLTEIPVDHGSPFIVAQHIHHTVKREDGSNNEYLIRTGLLT